MNFLKRIGIVLYIVLMLSAGCFFLLVFLNSVFPSERWAGLLDLLTGSQKGQIAFGVMGGIFLLIGIISPYRMDKKLKKSRMVSFRNPDGEVTVALSAIEEYIHKISSHISGIKDVKSHVEINKKGINVTASVSIASGVNIPEVTEMIQMEVKNKVQVMLGVEEAINVLVHIKRIAKGSGREEQVAVEDVNAVPSGAAYREGE